MRINTIPALAVLNLTVVANFVSVAVASDREPDFVRDVRPILSQHCFACHGPDEHARKAGLSLVSFESATAETLGGVRPIVPLDPDASEIVRRITDPVDPMPPRSAHNDLNDEQIETLKRWIRAGGSYQPHWAYIAPKSASVPSVPDEAWPRDSIDRFVLARLEEEKLASAADADDVTLIRRLTYDLTGLPPRTEDIDAFLSDKAANSYERVVDRLLASPRYGERMAMMWLDLVRYADTVGYHGDQEHHIWPYRDWVIRAFNENMPFDRFTIEQLAGDLLDSPSQEQLVATGYNRLLQTTHEGGLQLGEYRAIYMADRVRNVAATWMGATMGCAQCHDHKYDPYTTRDFYAMGAFFADIDDEEHLRNPYDGLNTSPTHRGPEMRIWSEDARRQIRAIDRDLQAVQRERATVIAELPSQRDRWEQAILRQVDAAVPLENVWVDDVLDTGGQTQGDWTFGRHGGLAPHSGSAYRTQASDGLVQHYTVDTSKVISVSEGDTFFAWVYVSDEDPASALMLQFHVDGSWEHRAVWGSDDIPYGRRAERWAGYQRMGPLPEMATWAVLEVDAEAVGIEAGAEIRGIAFTQFGGTVHWDKAGVRTGQIAPPDVLDAIRTPPARRTELQDEAIAAHQRQTSPDVKSVEARLASLERQRQEIEHALPLTMFTRALAEPREVRVLPRGNWLDQSGAVVEPAVPSFLGTISDSDRLTRLDLARWLVTPENAGGAGGKTARVFVNRVWAMLFGTGLCPSPEDFGGQGEPPNHPELLDQLAIDFVESGWDTKALIRRMVLTRTYRQSSLTDEETLRTDPLNHLYARQYRRRLPAEMVRDTALSVSGLLVENVGGASAKPPQPTGYYRHLNFPTREYEADTGEQQWRRGLYVHWQRQYLHPMLLAFDAPTREECTAQRNVSNTPLAALTLLNDPVFVEAARVFAQRILRAHPQDDAAGLAFAMREATGREPREQEVAVLRQLLHESHEHYAGALDEAGALLAVGSAPVPETLDPIRLAAWTQVARAVFNLHETITRD